MPGMLVEPGRSEPTAADNPSDRPLKSRSLIVVEQFGEAQDVLDDLLLLRPVHLGKLVQLCRDRVTIWLFHHQEISENRALPAESLMQLAHLSVQGLTFCLDLGDLLRAKVHVLEEFTMSMSRSPWSKQLCMTAVCPDSKSGPDARVKRE
jgi:hypothetical protein